MPVIHGAFYDALRQAGVDTELAMSVSAARTGDSFVTRSEMEAAIRLAFVKGALTISTIASLVGALVWGTAG